MPRTRKPVEHAITIETLDQIIEDTAPDATDFLAALEARGLRIARVPGRPRFRDAESGQYVSDGEARRHPEETVSET